MTDINYQLSKELGDELKRIGATISTVESCTGGGLASSMTDVSGSSQWFTSGLVTYSNFSKKHILGVQKELISSLGAVSLEVVREMAIKGLQKTGSDYVISISGIAGPSGGSPGKPIGTVCIAWGNTDMIESKIFFFSGDRQKVRKQTIETSLKEMLKYLKL